jgi:long-subunit fatty acid transport protein
VKSVTSVTRRLKKKTLPLCAVAVGAAGLLSAADARAAAYYVGEIGARSMARGGANIVNPRDPSAIWLNPAAVTLSTGVQLQLDLNLVMLQSEFVRDCAGLENGCAIPDTIDRTYVREGDAVAERRFFIEGGRRQVGALDSGGIPVNAAEPGRLGNRDRPSRFDGETAVRNEAGIQPIPRLFATFNTDSVGLDGFGVGVYVFAPSAGDYRFGEGAPTRYTLIDRDLLEVYYGLTAGYRFGDVFAIGGGFQLVTSGLNQNIRLTADTVGNEDENYDVQVRIEGIQHFIPSGNLGIWSNPGKLLGIGDLEIAASVQLPRFVKATGPIRIEQFGETLQRDFIDSGLASINDDTATATAEFVMAPFYRVGLKYGRDDLLGDGQKTIGFDVEGAFVYEQWSVYDHVLLTTTDLTFSTGGGAPTALPPIIQPKDWVDAFSLRLGGTLALWNRTLELHAGGFYETNAIPNSTYSVELVDGEKVGVGTGISGTWNGLRLDVGYSHIFVFDRVVGTESIVTAGNVEIPPPIAAEGELRTRIAMGQYRAGYDMLNVAVTVAFDDLFNFGVHAPKPVPLPAAMPVDVAPTETPAEAPTEAPVTPEAPTGAAASPDATT